MKTLTEAAAPETTPEQCLLGDEDSPASLAHILRDSLRVEKLCLLATGSCSFRA